MYIITTFAEDINNQCYIWMYCPECRCKKLIRTYVFATSLYKRAVHCDKCKGRCFVVESGQQKDPSVVNINMGKIKQEGGNDETAAVIAAATTIAHEVGHVKSYNQQQGFVGGESPAEAEERRVADWIKQNQGRLQDLLG